MPGFEELKNLCISNLQKLRENTGRLELWGIGALAFFILLGAAFLFLQNRPSSVPVIREVEEKGAAEKLKVHVAGAVVRPGVYELSEGERVIDAIKEAGGSLPEAHLDTLNLAAKLVDSQKIFVPKTGEVASTPVSPSGSDSKIPLNTATADQLDELPGIGEVLAKRIMEWREAHGRFNKLEELMEVEGIGAKKYNQLRDKIVLD